MSGAQKQWWANDPLASVPAAPAPTAVDNGKWWEVDPAAPTELAPALGGIVDDPKRRAPLATIATASLFPNTKDRIPVYAKALGIPPERFATVNGQIVYQDEAGQYVRVEPSVAGAQGVGDAASRLAGYAAGSVGPAIPAAASIGAGLATRGAALPIIAAGAAGGAGDVLRQGIGNAITGQPIGNIDYWNSAGQAALGAGGQAAGQGLQALMERAPPGLVAADRRWMANAGNVATAQANADLLKREGITGMMGPVTNRGGLLQADRQLMRNADTADVMRNVVQRVNTQEVPAAAERAATRIGPNQGIDQAAQDLVLAADRVKEFPRLQANAAARPAYAVADANKANMLSPDLAQLMDAPALKSALSRARATYANKYGPPPDVPDFRLWDLAKKQLDADYAAAGSPFSPAERASASGIDTVRSRLNTALESAYPSYATAKATAAPGMQASERLESGVVGRIAKTGDDLPSANTLAAQFNPTRTSPAAIAEARKAFEAAGETAAWESGFAAHVRAVADRAQRTLANGDPGNVAGKIHAELFGTDTLKSAAAAALGGKNTPAYQQFAETMRAMEIAARIPPMGSQTATDLGKIGAASSPTANAAASALRSANFFRWPQRIDDAADWIQNSSASKAALRTASQYEAGPAANRAALDMVRLLPPSVVGMLYAGSRGGLSPLIGMLGGASANGKLEPYQPPLPRP